MKSPFKFLDAYTADERHLFYGRDEEIDQLYRMVFQTDVLLVYGQSGTGKTSLIQCGLANRMQDSDWFEVFVRRKNDLNTSLDAALAKAAQTPFETDATLSQKVESLFLDYFKPIFLIFDQFEELFVLGNKDEYEQFVEDVQALLKSGHNCTLIFVIREEYLGQLYHFEKQVPQLLDKRLRVEPMGLGNVEKVIKGSCQAFDIALEQPEVTVPKIMDKISAGKSGVQLAYLQIYLDRLYREGGNTFTPALSEQVGDITEVLGDFLSEQQQAVQAALSKAFPKAPVTGIRQLLNEFSSLEGTKRPLAREHINVPDLSQEAITFSLKQLEDARLLRFNDGLYELAHDTLALHIAQGRDERERSLIEIVSVIRNGFRSYETTGSLLSERELQAVAPHEVELKIQQKLKQAEWGYLRQSRSELAQQKRKASRLRMGIIAALTLFSLFAGWQWFVAERERDESQRALANFWMSESGRKMVEYDFASAFRLAQHAKRENPDLAEVDLHLNHIKNHLADGQGKASDIISNGNFIRFFDQYNDSTRLARLNLWRRLADGSFTKKTFPNVPRPEWIFSPDSSLLAVFSLTDRKTSKGIYYLLRADSLQEMAQFEGQDDSYFWASEGQYFGFYQIGDSTSHVYLVDPVGNDSLMFDTHYRNVTAAPIGGKIAIFKHRPNPILHLQDLGGSWEDSILNATNGGQPQFDPTAQRISFVREPTIPDNRYIKSDLYVRELATGKEVLLHKNGPRYPNHLPWSSDGKCLVYKTAEHPSNNDLLKIALWSSYGHRFSPKGYIQYDLSYPEDMGIQFCATQTHKAILHEQKEASSRSFEGTSFTIWNYQTGETKVWQGIVSFELSADSSVVLLVQNAGNYERKLIGIDLANDRQRVFDRFSRYQIHPRKREVMIVQETPDVLSTNILRYWEVDSDHIKHWNSLDLLGSLSFWGFSDDGKYAIASRNGEYDSDTRRRLDALYFLNLATQHIDSLRGWSLGNYARSLDGKYFSYSMGDTTDSKKKFLYIYNLETHESWNPLSLEEDPHYDYNQFEFGYGVLAIMKGDRTLAFYDLEKKQKIAEVNHQRKLQRNYTYFPPHSSYAITYSENSWHKIIRLDTPLTVDYYDKILPPLDEEARKRYHILE